MKPAIALFARNREPVPSPRLRWGGLGWGAGKPEFRPSSSRRAALPPTPTLPTASGGREKDASRLKAPKRSPKP